MGNDDTFKHHVFDGENDDNTKLRYEEECQNVFQKIFDTDLIKLSCDFDKKLDESEDWKVDIRKEHKECRDENFDGLCVEAVNLAGLYRSRKTLLSPVQNKERKMGNECKSNNNFGVDWSIRKGYPNGIIDFDGPIKLSHDEDQKCEINVQKEHEECENKNNDGLCIESVRLSGSRKNKRQDFYIDKIQKYIEILKKMSMPEDILKEMSLETRNEINSVMIKINDKIILEAESLKKSLYYL